MTCGKINKPVGYARNCFIIGYNFYKIYIIYANIMKSQDSIKLKEDIYKLLDSFFSKKCLYILGSGVSKLYEGTFDDAKKKTNIDNRELGVFSAEANSQKSSLHKMIISEPSSNILKYDPLDRSLSETSNNRVETLYLKNIVPSKELSKRPEYEIFNLLRRPTVFFSFNHDKLLQKFVRKNGFTYLYPHNQFSEGAIRVLYSLNDIDMDYNFNLAARWGIHLPIKERESLLETEPYLALRNVVPEIDCIYIIGYSFCRQPDGTLHDQSSYNFILDLATFYKKEIVIISPDPYELENSITETCRTLRVSVFKAKWNVLTKSILDSIHFYPFINYYSGRVLYNILKNKRYNPQNIPEAWYNDFYPYINNPDLAHYQYRCALKQFIPIEQYKNGRFPYDNIIKIFFELDEKSS